MMEYKVEMMQRRAWRPASVLFGATYNKAVGTIMEADAILRTVKESWDMWTDERIKREGLSDLNIHKPSRYRIVSRTVTEWKAGLEMEA